MLYAVLAYHHVDSEVMSLSAEADAALMANLRKAHEKLESGTMIGKLVLRGWS